MRHYMLGIALCGGLGTAADAQSVSVGSDVTPVTVATAFERPPSGALGERGEMVAALVPGASFRLVERKVVVGALGEEEWLRLSASSDAASNPCATRACWVFNRRLGSRDSTIQSASTF